MSFLYYPNQNKKDKIYINEESDEESDLEKEDNDEENMQNENNISILKSLLTLYFKLYINYI